VTTGDPASRAADLVAGARRRATGNAVARALLRGAAVGALVAAAAAALSLAGGVRPGVWLLAALLPAAAAAAPGLRRARPSLAASALLLDRAAGTQERFVASLGARDPEVRDLVARQALDHPSVRSGRLPLTFPPSPEGLAAVLSAALLVGVLFLGPRLVTPGTVPDRREVGRVPAARVELNRPSLEEVFIRIVRGERQSEDEEIDLLRASLRGDGAGDGQRSRSSPHGGCAST